MFMSAFAPQSGFRRFCALPWISLVGGACYSLYLVHMQVIQILSTLAAKLAPGLSFGGVLAVMLLQIVIVIVAGLTFYVLIERYVHDAELASAGHNGAVGNHCARAIQAQRRKRLGIHRP